MRPSSVSREQLKSWLLARVSQDLDMDVSEIDPRMPLTRYGLTSIEAVSISGDLEAWLGRRLPPTLAWDHPSIEALVEALVNPDSIDLDLGPQ